MKACKDLCPVLKIQRCCFMCEKHDTCNEVCAEDSNDLCELLVDVPDGDCERQAEVLLQKLEAVLNQKNELKEQEDSLKEALQSLMEQYHETSLKKNTHMKVTYIKASETTEFDKDLFKKTDPATYAKFCVKPKKTKAYIKCELLKKGGEKNEKAEV